MRLSRVIVLTICALIAGPPAVGTTAAQAAPFVYVTNALSGNVSQFDVGPGGALSPKSPATVPAGQLPFGVAVSPDGASVYVTNPFSDNVSQFDVELRDIAAVLVGDVHERRGLRRRRPEPQGEHHDRRPNYPRPHERPHGAPSPPLALAVPYLSGRLGAVKEPRQRLGMPPTLARAGSCPSSPRS